MKRRASFLSRVNKSGPIHPYDPKLGNCWVWLGTNDGHGYGTVWFQGRMQKAHRVAFYNEHGRWASGDTCHSCDNRACCNPAHLFEGSRSDNMQDASVKGRLKRIPENTHTRKLTPRDVEYIRTHDATNEELAARFGVSTVTISAARIGKTWKAGISAAPCKRKPKYAGPRGDEHWTRKHPDRVHRGPRSLTDEQRTALTIRNRRLRAKLSEETAEMILSSKETGTQLSRRLGVSESTISLIRRRKTWVRKLRNGEQHV